MDQRLLEQLHEITEEERRILDGDDSVQKELYTNAKDFVIDSNKMLAKGKLIDVRPHTRFVHFPIHRHNYIEIIYMCSGETTHIINGNTTITLQAGELLFLNQNVTQEILPAGEEDVAVNFMVLPEFFDKVVTMIEEENVLRDFLIGSLKQDKSLVDFLHCQVTDILPIQNLIENMIWSIVNKQPNNRNINQTTMGLLFLQLINYTETMNQNDPRPHDQSIILSVMRYIEDTYKTGTLEEISSILKQPDYYISKMLKFHTGYTFKNLLQTKRLNQSAFLLSTTTLTIEDIIDVVGYNNSSYFHRIFRERFGMTPKTYRETCHQI